MDRPKSGRNAAGEFERRHGGQGAVPPQDLFQRRAVQALHDEENATVGQAAPVQNPNDVGVVQRPAELTLLKHPKHRRRLSRQAAVTHLHGHGAAIRHALAGEHLAPAPLRQKLGQAQPVDLRLVHHGGDLSPERARCERGACGFGGRR